MRLIVMRHAHSAPGSRDRLRPLTERGKGQACHQGSQLMAAGWIPQQALSSDAVRTRETWELVADQLGDEAPPVKFLEELYLASVSAALGLLGKLGGGADTVLLLGHNPTASQLVALLSGTPLPLEPAAVALLEVDAGSWPEACALGGAWSLHSHLCPPHTR